MGGGWCNTSQDCLSRSKTVLGTSTLWKSSIDLGGIFSNLEMVNGEFYNWNVVYMGYCDGGSFSGYRYTLQLAIGLDVLLHLAT